MATAKEKAAPEAAAGERIEVIALVPVQYDASRHEPGERFSVRQADLAQLLAVEAVQPAEQ